MMTTKWSSDEDKIIFDFYEKDIEKCYQLLPNRTKLGIKGRAYIFNIKRDKNNVIEHKRKTHETNWYYAVGEYINLSKIEECDYKYTSDGRIPIYKLKCGCGKLFTKTASEIKYYLSINIGIHCGCKFKEGDSKYIREAYLATFRRGAECRNIEFNITCQDVENVLISQNFLCFYTLDPIILPDCGYLTGKNKKCSNISIDRKNNDIGYTPDNICICVKGVNKIKMDIPISEFIEICKKVSNNPNFQ